MSIIFTNKNLHWALDTIVSLLSTTMQNIYAAS